MEPSSESLVLPVGVNLTPIRSNIGAEKKATPWEEGGITEEKWRGLHALAKSQREELEAQIAALKGGNTDMHKNHAVHGELSKPRHRSGVRFSTMESVSIVDSLPFPIDAGDTGGLGEVHDLDPRPMEADFQEDDYNEASMDGFMQEDGYYEEDADSEEVLYSRPSALEGIIAEMEGASVADAQAWQELHTLAQQRRLDLQQEIDELRGGARTGPLAAMPPHVAPRSGDWYWGWEKAIDMANMRKKVESENMEMLREQRLKMEAAAQSPAGAQAREDRKLAIRAKHARNYRVQKVKENKLGDGSDPHAATLKAAMQRAVASYQAGDWETAVAAFDAAAALEPSAIEPLYGAGHALWQAGDMAGAVKQFAAAIDVDPDRQAKDPTRRPWQEPSPTDVAKKDDRLD